MKVLVTGTHFTPAVATIEQLKKLDENVKIVYVGRKTTQEGDSTQSVESQILPTLGVKFIPLITGRLQRAITFYTLPSLLKIPIGIIQSLFIVLSEKPDVILSFGGYISVPIVFVSWLFSIPIIVHEQTLVSGLANKISGWFADKIAISFKESDFIGEKVILTGNPVRSEIIKVSLGAKLFHPPGGKLPSILVLGGNQGSHILNLAAEGILPKLLKIAEVHHQTGDSRYKDFERLEKLKNSGNLGDLGSRYTVKKWIGKEYPQVLQKADLVISRAGINTLTELAYVGKPALVVPIPYLYQNEQGKNAKYFEHLGLVETLYQSNLTPEMLLQKIKQMLSNLQKLSESAKQAKSAVIVDAAKRLALETMLLAKNIKV